MSWIPTESLSSEQSERRGFIDRRQRYRFFNLRHLGIAPRRKAHRRAGGSEQPFVDIYDAAIGYQIIAIVLLSCADAFFTLRLLSLGAVELNWLMAQLIESDIRAFVGFKVALTGLAMILLLVYKDFICFGQLQVERVIQIILWGYSLLIAYELVLLAIGYSIL